MTMQAPIPLMSKDDFAKLDAVQQRAHCQKLLDALPDSHLLSLFPDIQLDYHDSMEKKLLTLPEPERRFVEAQFLGRRTATLPSKIEVD